MKKEIKPYFHTVQYYETDGMRIVHHSNYIRWMEEARTDYLIQAGFPYDVLENRGILFPVLSVSCDFKTAVPFGGIVKIQMQLDWFDGLRYGVSYIMTNANDDSIVHLTGSTTHCFLNRDLRPMRIKKEAPDVYQAFKEYAHELRGMAAK